MKTRLYFMQTRSGLHCGIGQGVSDIDLPTAKDAVTGHPLVPGSSVKGVLRKRHDDGSAEFLAAFGPDPSQGNDFASALSFTDCRLISLPVRSYFGTYAHLSSPCTLALLKEELGKAGMTELPTIPTFPAGDTNSYRAVVPENSRLVTTGQFGDRLLLEELDLLKDTDFEETAGHWANLISRLVYPDDSQAAGMFARGFAIVDDNVFDFFCETGLPVAAHNRIGPNGVVADGALWYEEFVPAEALFLGAVYGENGRGENNTGFAADDLLNMVCNENDIDIQIGGNATTGRGLVTMRFINIDDGENTNED